MLKFYSLNNIGKSEVATKDHETEKCIFSKLKQCTDEIPPMPCWIKPKTIPAKYRSRAKAGTEFLATKFMREKMNYREKVACFIFVFFVTDYF